MTELTKRADCHGLAQMVAVLAYGNMRVYYCILFQIVQHPTIVRSVHYHLKIELSLSQQATTP